MDSLLDAAVLSRVVRAQAARDPDRVVLVFENGQLPAERVTAGQLATRSNQIAAVLARAGLRGGDRVAVMLRNNPEFVYGLVANAQLALPTVPVDPRARGEKLRYFLRFAGCAALITADYVVADEDVARTIRDCGVRTWVVSTPEGRAMGLDYSADWPLLNTAFTGGEAPDAGEHVEDVASPWLLAYTSGTTGDPKAIEFGHDRMVFYRRLPDFFGYRPDDVTYTGLSLTHGNALIATMMPAIWGAVDHAVLSRWFTKSRLWDICIDHGVTTWSNLGGIATAVYSEPTSPKDRAHRVRLVISAGMPREIWRAFEERFAVRVLEWYGTMEGGFAYNPVGKGPVGSFGKPPEGLLEMDVVDEDDRPVEPRQVGELVLRPAGGEAKLTYYKNPEASARKVRDGWLHTGDMVSRDAEGWFYFSHRREEGGLRKAGEFISEGFIRRVLAEDPDIADVHIYGIPARSGAPGETDIVAAVVPADADTFTPEAVFTRCAARLERSHVPDFLQVVGDLPRTASEKVQVRFLVEQLTESADNVFSRPTVAA
jgi:acyl-CoA synthetase (AMP-forming)/AMP-acid ligase II